jgi:N-acetylglucosamine kinase
MKNRYLIGLDGGGTKTKCVITDFDFNPLYTCAGGASNFLIIGTEKVSESILSLVQESINHLNISEKEVSSIFIGTTGAGRITDADKLKNDFIKYASSKGFSFLNFNVDSDARIALEGAFSGKSGALLIAGTGSIIFGKDSSGNVHRVGGFGRFLGDEGSGNTLGRKGLTAIAKDFDGRSEKTSLTERLKKHFGIENSAQLITEVYRNNFDMASFAPHVIEAAKDGDETAIKIIEDESDELILHVKSIYKMIGTEKLNLCLVGGTIATENFYADLFRKKINEQMPYVQIIPPENPPEIGAAFMAKSFVHAKT